MRDDKTVPGDAPDQSVGVSYTLDEIVASRPLVKVLSNGRLSSAVTAAGATRITLGDLAINAWRPDPTLERGSSFVYLRDLETGHFWSAGLQPCPDGALAYRAFFDDGFVRLERLQRGIRSILTIRVAPEDDVEIRDLLLRNETDVPRRLDVISYVEVALNDHAAHLAHPAFSKLFVQTAADLDRQALRAWRRRRSPEEDFPRLLHFACGAGEMHAFETSRPHFIGRGRSISDPVALTSLGRLEGLEGSVLDPCLALRREVLLEAGAETNVTLGMGVGWTPEDLDALRRRYGTPPPAAEPPSEAERHEPLAVSARPTPDRVARRASEVEEIDGRVEEPLRFYNGYGGFSETGDEYVIRLRPGDEGRLNLPPQPWVNVIANDQIGFIVSETGAGCTWAMNSRENRITPWFNDPVSDPHGEAFYVRDEQDGRYWSLLPGPAPAPTDHETRHGLGYTTFRQSYGGLLHTTTQFVAPDQPVKVTYIRLRNLLDRMRSVSVFAYHEIEREAEGEVRVEWSGQNRAQVLRARRDDEFSESVPFFAVRGGTGETFSTTDRAAFLGRLGDPSRPHALEHVPELHEVDHTPFDSCSALQIRLAIPAGGESVCAVLAGCAHGEEEIPEMLRRFEDLTAWESALDEVREYWARLTHGLRIQTPVPEIDLMVNTWLPYQNLSCRLMARSAFYQSGGAFGYRDQLQDAAAFVYTDSGRTRRQILLHAGKQFVEGDVLHWWHPPSGRGIRTRFSDDLLWLPYVTAHYVRTTGDHAVLDEIAPFLRARCLEEGEDEVYLVPRSDGDEGSLYEHCCRALDRSLTKGPHGLPLMGTGDWNDGMNRVGRLGRGESVWLGFFISHILGRFIPLCTSRGDLERASAYEAHRRHLLLAVNEEGWDGEWYRRAYYDDGEPLGSAQNAECRIDALAQAWAVISGAAPHDRARLALDAMDRELVDENAGIIRLLTPPFDLTPKDPGYIKGYVPGVRENGGQYTHGVLWVVRALAEAGQGGRAAELLRILSPISHTNTRDAVARYRVEPYVIAADVYGEPPHTGRGGWTWYTGSAGWMWRVAIESVLGFRIEDGTHITLQPSIPEHWREFSIAYRIPGCGGSYEIRVANPDGRSSGVRSVNVNGEEFPHAGTCACIPLQRDTVHHRVEIVM